jgi:HipA-like C-terminal domain
MPSPRAGRFQEVLLQGPTPARRLIETLGVSRPTLAQLVRASRGQVVRIGRARATHYALKREIRTLGDSWRTYRIDARGRSHLVANLHALVPRSWWYEPIGGAPAWLHGEFAQGIFPDLPWFLDDLRPQGFVGRAFARRHANELGLNPDPQLWDAAGVLVALILHGDDLPGDFVIGDVALERAQRATLAPPSAIAATERATRYDRLAEAAIAGEMAGSSAGGEQPKFTACVDEAGSFRHVLVKFSPPLSTSAGRRWADLLVCEHLAAEALREAGIAACETTLIEGSARHHLEVIRFDRVGAHGRRGSVTLFALDNTYYGKLDTWPAAAGRLQHDGWLRPADADTLRLLWWFGGLIGNTDMHFANVSFALDDARPLDLAPAYDMLPMHYRPSATGEVLTRPFTPPLPPPQELSLWRRAATVALVFWERASDDARISPEFRAEAARLLGVTRSLCDRLA